MAISDGVYEIRYANAPTMAVDVYGASTTKGANVDLYSVNHSNAQVFYIDLEDTDKWSVRNVYSGMYMDVNGGSATKGTNVQQWTQNQSRAQLWRIVETGETMTIEGVTCPIVKFGSYVTNDADTYYLDVNGAMTTNKTNIHIWTKNGTGAQVFALYPTTKQDTSLPVPSMQGWTKTLGGTDYAFSRAAASTLYPAWLGTQSWASNTSNGFEGRWRERSMDSDTSTWGEWSDDTAWATVSTTRDGTSYWLTSGLPATLSSGDKARQYEFQLRAFAGAGDNRVRGLSASATLTAAVVPNVTITNFAFGPYGLRVPYTSDYDGGMTKVAVYSVYDLTTDEKLLDKELVYDLYDTTGTIFIPTSELSGWIGDGDRVTVSYRVGSDLIPPSEQEWSTTANVSYNAGTITPTLTAIDGRRLMVEVEADVVNVWYRYNEAMTEVKVENGVAYVPYPFGEFELFVSAMNGDVQSDDWGLYHATMVVGAGILANKTPCHAWSWGDTFFLLECNTDPLATEGSFKPLFETFSLNNREYQSVYFQGTIASEFTAVGVLLDGLSESNLDQMALLARANHVVYRGPFGEVANVAVTGITYKTRDGYTEVTVSMIEETV